MKLRRLPKALASFTVLLSPLFAFSQTTVPQFTDPANLRGERVKPRDGRELPIDQGARGLEQMLRKLNTRASLMLIVAHPDDEDGGMLTYYSRGLGARVAVLTLTRGEGGQNAMTGDFGDALGLLRTQELLSADRYLGVDQFFGTEVDFGFSKTKEEAFKKWTHERVLYDAVRSIRLYRPLVIAAVFIGGVTDGHGQHQVSGQIAQEAFKAAADSTVFPDMIAEGILPWQALKVYARVPSYSISDRGLFDYATGKYTAARFENYVTGEVTTTTPSSDVVVHEGTVDPILSDSPSDPPRTYVQFARIGLGMQKSQIGGGIRVPPAGAFDVAYHLYGSALCSSATQSKGCHPERSAPRGVEGSAAWPLAALPPRASSHNSEAASFFDGIDTSIEGIADLAPDATGATRLVITTNLKAIAHSISEAQMNLRPGHPELAAQRLSEALELTDTTINNIESFPAQKLPVDEKETILHELRVKRVQLNDALLVALGLQLDATTSSGALITHSRIAVNVVLAVNGPERVSLFSDGLVTMDGTTEHGPFADSGPTIVRGVPLTHQLIAGSDIVRTETRPYFLRDNIEQPVYKVQNPLLRDAPATPPSIVAWASLQFGNADIKIGRVVEHSGQPVQCVPAGSVSVLSHAQVMAATQPNTVVTVKVSPPKTRVEANIPDSWKIELDVESTDLKSQDLSQVRLTPPASKRTTIEVKAVAMLHGQQEITEGYRPIGYGDLPRTNYYTPATVRIVPVDLNLPHARIAYLPGTGDAVPDALASINLKPEILTLADLTPAKLAQYETVILGVRTYAAHHDLHGAPTQALLDYARNGGNVLVQYQTTEFTGEDAPYPLSLGSNEKVVDEDAPVQLSDSKAPFLSTPNKITPADFNDWVEERGHGFLSTWDAHYTALTETHDPDQDPQRGGLITTPLGKGRWTYCAFALYRQLPEAVPGAFRLFVNLLGPAPQR